MVTQGEREGRGSNWEFGINRYTLVYIKHNQQGPTVWHKELYSIDLIITYKGKESERGCIYSVIHI